MFICNKRHHSSRIFCLDSFAIGAFVGTEFALIVAYLVDDVVRETAREEVVGFGAIAATLFAAALALAGIRSQISHNQSLEDDRTRAKLTAARAMLLTALVEFSKFAKDGALTSANGSTTHDQYIESNTSFEIVKEVIEYADPISARWLAAILALYQVFSSRQRNGSENQTTPGEWLLFQKAIGHCFAYARFSNGCDKIPEELGNEWNSLPEWALNTGDGSSDVTKTQEEKFKVSLREASEKLSGTLREFEGGRIKSLEERQEAGN